MEAKGSERTYGPVLDAGKFPVITADMLKYFYQNKSVVDIRGDGYDIILDGSEIVNWTNELQTNIEMSSEAGETTFVLNKGKELCGPLTLKLNQIEGKYLYLWNSEKGKYERLETDDLSHLKLTSAGRYLISDRRIQGSMRIVWAVLVCGTLAIAAGVAFYIWKNKKYWFW